MAPGAGVEVVEIAVMLVWSGDGIDPVWRVNVIVPGPVKVTGVTSVDPAQDRPLVHAQLETEYPMGT